MPKQICRGRDFWAPLVKEFEEGGAAERHKQFAARHNVQCSSFETWLYRLRAEKEVRPQRRNNAKHIDTVKATPWPLVEVQGVPIGDSRFEIELPGERRLRVPAAFDAEALGRLLKVLSEVVS
ncbi:MAG: hypothetical protein WCG85_23865 [Polyangia bacterium]|jgi:hypothetical protein